MAVEIKETEFDTITVNGKELYYTGTAWATRSGVELTAAEQQAVADYLTAKRHTR